MNPQDLQFGAPIEEKKLPPSLKKSHYKFMDLFEKVMKLPSGKLLPVTCPDEEKARKLYNLVAHTTFAAFRCFARGKVVYIRLRNEKDEQEAKRIKELRDLGKQSKEGHA